VDLVLCLKQGEENPGPEGEEQNGRGFLASVVGQLSKPFICREVVSLSQQRGGHSESQRIPQTGL